MDVEFFVITTRLEFFMEYGAACFVCPVLWCVFLSFCLLRGVDTLSKYGQASSGQPRCVLADSCEVLVAVPAKLRVWCGTAPTRVF